jgi:hypothetical protein
VETATKATFHEGKRKAITMGQILIERDSQDNVLLQSGIGTRDPEAAMMQRIGELRRDGFRCRPKWCGNPACQPCSANFMCQDKDTDAAGHMYCAEKEKEVRYISVHYPDVDHIKTM